jgi:hypothetical protein
MLSARAASRAAIVAASRGLARKYPTAAAETKETEWPRLQEPLMSFING